MWLHIVLWWPAAVRVFIPREACSALSSSCYTYAWIKASWVALSVWRRRWERRWPSCPVTRQRDRQGAGSVQNCPACLLCCPSTHEPGPATAESHGQKRAWLRGTSRAPSLSPPVDKLRGLATLPSPRAQLGLHFCVATHPNERQRSCLLALLLSSLEKGSVLLSQAHTQSLPAYGEHRLHFREVWACSGSCLGHTLKTVSLWESAWPLDTAEREVWKGHLGFSNSGLNRPRKFLLTLIVLSPDETNEGFSW